MTDGTPTDSAAQAWRAMRSLVLDLHDRRQQVAATLGISFIRTKALRQLAVRAMTMRELAAALVIDAPYTTVVVDDLESRGLVERRVHPVDRRSRIVTVTPRGRELAEQAERLLGEPPAALADLEPDELHALNRILRALVDRSAASSPADD
jgi:DNA-binding MarR family transcriptional regulator